VSARKVAVEPPADKQVSRAWEADPEFGNALNMAHMVGELKPLRDYVAAGKPIPREQVDVAGELVPMHTSTSPICWAASLNNKKRTAACAVCQAKRHRSR
jgi:hypothetical protein